MKKENIYTLAFIIVIISMVSISNYGIKSSNWVYIIFPDKNKDALKESFQNIDYIADSSEEYNSVTAYVKNGYERDSLKEKGAILLDPKGVPLCLSGT